VGGLESTMGGLGIDPNVGNGEVWASVKSTRGGSTSTSEGVVERTSVIWPRFLDEEENNLVRLGLVFSLGGLLRLDPSSSEAVVSDDCSSLSGMVATGPSDGGSIETGPKSIKSVTEASPRDGGLAKS
jgi:hypothetical protein